MAAGYALPWYSRTRTFPTIHVFTVPMDVKAGYADQWIIQLWYDCNI